VQNWWFKSGYYFFTLIKKNYLWVLVYYTIFTLLITLHITTIRQITLNLLPTCVMCMYGVYKKLGWLLKFHSERVTFSQTYLFDLFLKLEIATCTLALRIIVSMKIKLLCNLFWNFRCTGSKMMQLLIFLLMHHKKMFLENAENKHNFPFFLFTVTHWS